jgi:hypothetical protein
MDCKDCKWAARAKRAPDYLRCHLNPPQLVSIKNVEGNRKVTGFFPIVNEGDFCSYWEARPDAPAANF